MKQNLLDYIKNKNNFRQILLNQDGGIMKYWAEHPDTDGRDALWKGYRNQCTKTFRDSNKWFMGEDSIKREALAYDHIKKELAYQLFLKHELSDFPEISEQADCFITDYLNYAFGEFQQNLHPNSYTSMEFYENIISEFFAIGLGRPWRCLYLILDEYRGKAKKNKSVDDLWTEFEIRQYARKYHLDMAKGKLSQAVKEIIDEKTRSKNKEECRQICRKEAKEVMKKLLPFVRMVNGDCNLVMYDGAIWSTKDLEYKGINVSKKIKKKDIVISKEEMVWLRGGMLYDGTKQTSLQECFSSFYSVLEEIGNVWAVQLKEYGINIRELEKETGCVLNKKGFYVEHSLGGGFGKIIIIRDDDDGVEDKCNINNCELNSEKKVEKNCYNSNVFENCQVTINNTSALLQPQDKIPVTDSQSTFGSKKDNKDVKKGKYGKDAKPAGLPKTLAYFTSDIEDDERKARKERVEAVFRLWTKWEWIDKNTIADDFHSFFKGHDRHCNIKWTTSVAILTLLLKTLIRREDVITVQTGCHPNSLVIHQFGFKKADYRDIDETNKKRIDFTIFVLDVINSFQDIYKEAQNKMSDVDKTLMKYFADDELKSIEEEAKRGNVHIGKSLWY